jgi:hypothetical protein
MARQCYHKHECVVSVRPININDIDELNIDSQIFSHQGWLAPTATSDSVTLATVFVACEIKGELTRR